MIPSRFLAPSFLFLIFILSTQPTVTHAAVEVPTQDAPGIYISGSGVDLDYIRREIGFVRYVRDRKQADVHVLVSQQRTASNGTEYTAEFIGQMSFAGRRDTLTYVCREADTQDDRRARMVRILKIGLLPYAASYPVAEHLTVTYDQPLEPVEVVDPWDHWWFSLSGNTYVNGDQNYRNINAWGSVNAQRVTEEVKFNFRVYGSYNESKYDYDYYQALSIARGKGSSTSIYFSLDDHWSWGASAGFNSSEYGNLDYSLSLKPGIEYDIFPYDESSRRRLSFTYQIAGRYADYIEETIYDRTTEMRYQHSLRVKLDLTQPWGSIYTAVTGSQYFHDPGKNWLGIDSNISVNLFEGFSLQVRGGYSLVHDQLSLRKGEATEEEILLRRRELGSSYSYWTSVGFSYSFGSQNNSIVNPRF